MKILGFQSGHDVSYCILDNGVPVIHEELERFIREKEPMGDGLEMALQRVPDETLKEIKYFSYGNPRGRTGSYKEKCAKEYAENEMKQILKKNNGEYFVIGHHQSHAANAFFSSNYDEALIITIDGSGTEKSNYLEHSKEFNESTPQEFFSTSFTFWKGKGNKIEPILRIPMERLTLGSPWRIYTREIFKLSSGHPHGLAAGTIMAMASVGDPNKYYKDFYNAFMAGGGGPSIHTMNNCKKYSKIAKKSEQEKFDIAAGIQKATEMVVYEIIKPIIEKHKPKNICFSGGVILNSVMMGKMYDWFNIKNMYVCPVPYDGGLAIGSAQYVWHQILDNPRIKWEGDCPSYMGVTYSSEEVLQSLNNNNKVSYSEVNEDYVLNLLDQQNIISIFHGGAESGRRALGNRSIIADPRSPKMKDLINKKVKHRQWFRPFAPSILKEDVDKWFIRDIESPYMSFVLPFKEEVKDKIPAVVHLDGTGRLQTVTEKNNKWYYNFIKKWKEKTGIPIILNTSFNDREPIVETPEHAINCFLRTNIDYLYFSDYKILVKKEEMDISKMNIKMRYKPLFLSDVTNDEFNAIYNVINQCKNLDKIKYLEVGCNAGGTLLRILQKSKRNNLNIQITALDLFEDIIFEPTDNSIQTHRHEPLEENKEIYTNTVSRESLKSNLENLGFNNDRITLIKGYSDDTIPLLEDKFDVIFIDGNHTYNQCKQDFLLSFEKSKIGTYFIFHNAGIEEVESCYPDGGPYKVCEELKQMDTLKYEGKPTPRVKVFKRVK